MKNFTMVSLAFPRAVRQVAVHLDEEIKAGSSLLIKSGGRQDGETAVCLEDEDGGLFQHSCRIYSLECCVG